MATCEAIWLNKRILKDLHVSINDPILIYYDNFNNIHLAPNLVLNARTKHIKVHYNFIKQHVIVGDVDLQHISMNLQTADIFKKVLGADKPRQFSTEFGLSPSTC